MKYGYEAHAHDVMAAILHMAAILVFRNNETAAMLLYQTNPVGVQLLSYVNTFFCHVSEPNQSCASSTFLLYVNNFFSSNKFARLLGA